MSSDIKNSKEQYYYSGGLAELITTATVLTYSFLKEWFVGSGSLGNAMELLHMPYAKVDLPILESVNNELLVNLANEEKTLYVSTVFTYQVQKDLHEIPQLKVSFSKVFNPLCLINTLRILLIQSLWIANPQETVTRANELVKAIPDIVQADNIEQIDKILKEKVWVNVIAIGLISEFYNQLAIKEAKEKTVELNKYISHKIAKGDWFFRSFADQELEKQGEMTFSTYIEKYGLRADKDYELTSPRWHEIPETIKKRINNISGSKKPEEVAIVINEKLAMIANTSIELQLLRSEAKRKTLLFIDRLRQILLQETANVSDIGLLTKDDIVTCKIQQGTTQVKTTTESNLPKKIFNLSSGKGVSVSQGTATGVVRNISDNDTEIPQGIIGIFPNASPEFAIQYPKCVGMIFLKGGQTSHGAIVAREFGIPAIIDSKIEGIKDGLQIELHSTTGEWRIV